MPGATPTRLLIVIDLLAYLALTVYGFATHRLLGAVDAERLLATLLPFWSAYASAAMLVGAYRAQVPLWPAGVARAALAAALSAPLGAAGRSLWLGTPLVPVFVAVMAGVGVVFVAVGRGLVQAGLALRRRRRA